MGTECNSNVDVILYGSPGRGPARDKQARTFLERLQLDPEQLELNGLWSDSEMGWSGAEGWIVSTTLLPVEWMRDHPWQEKSFLQHALIRIYEQQRSLGERLETDQRILCRLAETDDPNLVSLQLDGPLSFGDLGGRDQLLLNAHPLAAIQQLTGGGEWQVNVSTHMGTWQQLIYVVDTVIADEPQNELIVGSIDLDYWKAS